MSEHFSVCLALGMDDSYLATGSKHNTMTIIQIPAVQIWLKVQFKWINIMLNATY